VDAGQRDGDADGAQRLQLSFGEQSRRDGHPGRCEQAADGRAEPDLRAGQLRLQRRLERLGHAGDFASAGTGGLGINYDYCNAFLAAHSGPSLYEDPVVIHPPNSPLGHTDEMYALHPGGADVLFGDGSVKFIKETINLRTWSALSSRSNREVVSADAY
jgi:prepilin-type processing-associated H-X9-DG protein